MPATTAGAPITANIHCQLCHPPGAPIFETATVAGAIKAGDGEAARAAMTTHVQSNLGYLTELARSNPGFLMVES